jgi:hypothetical protein
MYFLFVCLTVLVDSQKPRVPLHNRGRVLVSACTIGPMGTNPLGSQAGKNLGKDLVTEFWNMFTNSEEMAGDAADGGWVH